MNIERAQEILKGTDEITVLLDGKAVWIDEVNVNNHEVHVHEQQNPQAQKIVSVHDLQEQ